VRTWWLSLCVLLGDGHYQHKTVTEAVGLGNARHSAIPANEDMTGLADRDEATLFWKSVNWPIFSKARGLSMGARN
jgi:hypothetical protein